MVNEAKTENLVRNMLNENGYYINKQNIIVEEKSSDNPKINKLLQTASKKGICKGYPEFIISFKDRPDDIIIIECKAEIKKHESNNRKKYAEYAVDGVLLYASYLRNDFNVVAIAVSGETERELKVSHFLWLKGNYIYKDVTDKSILNPESLFNVIEKQSQPLKEEELIKKAIEYNELLYSYSIPEVDRCTIISSILIALQYKAFSDSYNSYHTDEDNDPNEELIKALLNSCRSVLKRNKITSDKEEIIIREYEKIKSNNTFRSRTITVNRKMEQKNTVLRDLINDIMYNIMPYIKNNVYDVLGKFYTQFIRYAGSDRKTGLVLTPPHITDFFCDLAEINEHDIVYDPCCGTGGFLVAAMNRMLEISNDITKHKKIKSDQLIGVENRPDMFSHACSNMMMRGDGKSHIYFGDCFSSEIKKIVTDLSPTKVFLNPPYNVGADGQLEFIENAMDSILANGICIAICQFSTCTDNKKATESVRKRLLEKHTLEAVLSMPDDLFHPIGVITSILVFKAHTPHPGDKKTFFGYFKNDGFVKVKHKGRIDQKENWDEIKQKWIEVYKNRESIAGLSVMHKVTAKDEWCAEAYMETDYSSLTDEDFIKTIKDFVAFQFLQDDKL